MADEIILREVGWNMNDIRARRKLYGIVHEVNIILEKDLIDIKRQLRHCLNLVGILYLE